MSPALIAVIVVIAACSYALARRKNAEHLGARIWDAVRYLLVFLCIGYMSFTSVVPQEYTYWVAPWEHRGTFRVTDLDGSDCTVRVCSKQPFQCQIPPGIKPILKLTASSAAGTTTLKYPTNWRFGVGKVRAARGGVEVFMGWNVGVRFQTKGTEWVITTDDVWAITSIQAAVEEGCFPAAMRLLAEGADPNERDAEGRAMLHNAAGLGHTKIVEALLRAGADVDARDPDGRTALHLAAHARYADIVKMLLQQGAAPGITDDEGKAPRDVARLGRIREMLDAAGASPSDGGPKTRR